MRKFHFLFLIASLLVTGELTAQNSRNWQYYGKAGWTYSTLLTKSEAAVGFAGGYTAGFGLEIPLRAGYYFQTELCLTRYKSAVGSDNNERRLSFTYVTVPLLLTYKYNDIFEFVGGVEGGFLAKASSTSVKNVTDIINFPPSDFSKLQVWPTAGLEINMSPLNIGLRYIFNPFKTFKNDQLSTAYPDARIHGGQLYGALVF